MSLIQPSFSLSRPPTVTFLSMLFPKKRERDREGLSLYLCFLYASVGPSSYSEMALVDGGQMVPLCLLYRYNPAGSTIFIFYSVLFPLSICRCAMAWPFIHAQSRTIWLHTHETCSKLEGEREAEKSGASARSPFFFIDDVDISMSSSRWRGPSGGDRFILPHSSVCLIIRHSRLSGLFVVATAICHGTATLVASFVEWRKGITVRRELNGGEKRKNC